MLERSDPKNVRLKVNENNNALGTYVGEAKQDQ
jgi:hypothetical protein